MMRAMGSTILLAAIGLIAYLAWITSHVGVDGFLMAGFGVAIISVIVAIAMMFFSFRIAFEEEVSRKTENIRKKEHLLSRKCG